MFTLVVEVPTGTPFVFVYDNREEAIREANNLAFVKGRRATVYARIPDAESHFDTISTVQIFTVGSLDN